MGCSSHSWRELPIIASNRRVCPGLDGAESSRPGCPSWPRLLDSRNAAWQVLQVEASLACSREREPRASLPGTHHSAELESVSGKVGNRWWGVRNR